MKLYYKEEPRTIVIASNSYSLGFRALPAPPQLRDQMVGEQLAVAVELLPSSRVTRENGYRLLLNKEIFGCLGLIEIGKKPYLSVITGSIQQVARPIRGESVDKIYAVDFISLVDSEWDFAEERAGAGGGGGGPGSSVGGFDDDLDLEYIHPCTELRKLLSNGSFYYSNDFDLTSLLQNRGVKTLELSQQQQQQNYQKEYMWNTFMMQQLFKFRANLDSSAQKILDDSKIFTTVIRGFAKTVKVNAQDLLTLISKQSWKRAGTRFNARGIDDDGNVANFVESELIFDSESKKQIYSFIQVRGSVPAFWEQDSTLINPKITITRSLEATQPIFDKHFTNSICNKYGVCHVLNLLSKTKPAEVSLSRRYKELYYASNHREEIEFSDFDFHQETKQMGFAGATKILPIIQSSLEQFGWFVYDVQEREIITRQDGIFRTNCLDCLDRTNLIQQVISRNIVENILRNSSSGGHREELYAEDVLARHNLLWADNGDAISQIYTGTNALKSSFSRSGKMNFAGALSDVTKSVSRMYQNTFVDSKKQTLMDILLGNDATARQVKIYNPTNEYVQEQLKSKKKLFTTESNIDIFVGTFNVNAANPMQPIDLTTWLFPPENYNKLPDIFSIGIQEIIELNAGSILAADSTRATMWTKLIENQLNSQGSGEGYLLLRTELIALMTLLLFVKKSKVQHITQVTGSSKKTGLGGIAANKGACAVRFEYGATSFVMITSHLAAGVNATVERYNDYQTIMQGLVFPRNYTIKDHDHIMWFGDLNYRINMPNDQCRSLVEHGAFDELLRTDQLNQEFNTGGAFGGFKEGMIKFYPTYKFDKGTSNYDTSEKQRVPSWTDRVLYKSAKNKGQGLKQISYNSIMDIYVSDHKPVYSTFQGLVEFVDIPKKKEIAREFYLQYKKEHGGDSDVSLLDVPESGNEASSSSSSSSSTASFAQETLSTLNLLDMDLDSKLAPRLPVRPRSDTLPKRIPPPPINRSDGASPSPSIQAIQPPPPPPRRATTSVPPIGYSSTPLIPSRSSSATPSNIRSPQPPLTPQPQVSSPKLQSLGSIPVAPTPLKPLVPSKPISLASAKTAPPPVEEIEKKPATFSPLPPAPRKATTTAPPGMNMNDWKPLVPK